MSRFTVENFGPDFDIPGAFRTDFDPVGLYKLGVELNSSSMQRIVPESLDFSDPYESLTSFRGDRFQAPRGFDFPSTGDILGLNFHSSFMRNPLSLDGILAGNFGDSFGFMSNLLSRPDNLVSHGLFGGAEGFGGILGHITNPVKGLFNGFGEAGSFGGILGGLGNWAGPVGGILGGLLGRGQEGVGGMLSSLAGGFAFGGPFGAGVAALMHLGLDKLAGKVLGGVANVIGDFGGLVGHGIKGLTGAIGGGIKAIGGGIKKLFGF
ncbi:MAG TPA: hypothetical protein PKZ32_03440 [Candidatus Melainabacteria bacterium]|nr:hypothetical protein [Candidatus Melainabacteria bacterium]